MGKHSSDADIRESYENNILTVCRDLSEALSQVCSHDRQENIRNIVDRACSLALDFGMQRCRLQLFAPQQNDTVSRSYTNTYRDVNGDNGPDLAQGAVQLVVWPGLRKTGDGLGGFLDQSTDLYPAGVYLV